MDNLNSEIDYTEQLLGFIVRESGIPLTAWVALAEGDARLIKQPPSVANHPFLGRMMMFRSNNYCLEADGRPIGLLVWEQSECLGVAGRRQDLAPIISDVCSAFGARFQAVTNARSVP